jgi:hypothetical protein
MTGSTARLVGCFALRSRIANLLPPSSGDYSRCEGTTRCTGASDGLASRFPEGGDVGDELCDGPGGRRR